MNNALAIEAMYDAARTAYATGDNDEGARLWADAQLARLGSPQEVPVYDASRVIAYDPHLEAAQHYLDSREED